MVHLRVTWKYCLAFYCVIMLTISLHELIHHFSGFLICGAWGTKSFNYFSTACEGVSKSWWATYAGPLFTFAMMYVGVFYLNSDAPLRRHLGFALIFAQLPLQRMTSPAFRMNDEFAATINLFGDTPFNYWAVLIVIWAICIPPLVKAYLAIENKHRLLWFLFYFVLFPYLIWGPIFGLLEYLMVGRGFLDQTVIGIGLLFIINEVVTIAGYLITRKNIDPMYSG